MRMCVLHEKNQPSHHKNITLYCSARLLTWVEGQQVFFEGSGHLGPISTPVCVHRESE